MLIVYFWKKPKESRTYMSQVCPDADQRYTLRSQGFKIYKGMLPFDDSNEGPFSPEHDEVVVGYGKEDTDGTRDTEED